MAAWEAVLTEKEKKRSNAAKGEGKKRGKEKRLREGGDDEFSLLQGHPRHVPALS